RSVPLVDLHSFPTRRSSDLFPVVLQIQRELLHLAYAALYLGGISIGQKLRTLPSCGFSLAALFTGQGYDGCPNQHNQDNAASTPDRKSTRLNSSHVKISYAV